MRTVLHYIGEIRAFLNEKTGGTAGDVSNAVLKRLLMEAYNSLPFLLPLRLVITAEQFADFLIEKKEDLFNENPSKKRRTVRKTAQTKSVRRKSTTTKTNKPTRATAHKTAKTASTTTRTRSATAKTTRKAHARTIRRTTPRRRSPTSA
ncbi:MAG: hypothetical protein J0L94_04690 [Rhodothermia bacterium]|nr:hypothetical protein [Rhodothermia bacterium]